MERTGRHDAATDDELMRKVREGDLARLGELFERHARRLHNFFLRSTGDRAAAEDLVQEVFVRMLKYRGSFQAGAEFSPWMWALARNAATDQWRGRPRELAVDPEAPEPASHEPAPIDSLERRDELERLGAALGRLDAEQRELLLLARFSELRYDHIATLLGISVGAVKVRVHRALKQLRAAYLGAAGEGVA